MNRVARVENAFGIDNLAVRDEPSREPGHGEIRLRVKAVSLNRRDLLLVQGIYNPRQPLPVTPCSDAAGVVEAVGPGCRHFKRGDRAVVHFFTGWVAGEPTSERLATALGGAGGDGTLSDTIVVPEDAVLPLADAMSFEAAATLPCAGLTGWAAIVDHGQISPDDTVLVQGTGGVSLFALQFARLVGARVMAVTSSEEKAERLTALGAEAVFLRGDPDWPKKARSAADGRIDLIVELGGADTLATSLRLIRPGGTIALIGVLGGPDATIPLPLSVMRQVRLQGVTCGPLDSFRAMLRAVERHRIDPLISHRFDFDDCRDAFRLMERDGHFGKIVIRTENASA